MATKPVITDRQRTSQESHLRASIELLGIAIKETKTATPDEIARTIDTTLEILHGVNKFLKTRRG